MKKLFLLLALFVNHCFAQELKYYRYDNDFLTKEFHKGRRDALREKMPNNSAAILFASPERTRSNDDDYPYHQDPGFYYLTGFNEPNSALLIFKSPQTLNGITSDEFLFVPDHNPEVEAWTGRRAGTEGAKILTGMNGVFLAAIFDSIKVAYDKFDKIFYTIPKGVIDHKSETDELADMIESFKKKCNYPPPNGDNARLRSILNELREIKLPEEIVLLKKAVKQTCEGQNEVMRKIKSGMHEYDVQAIAEYVFKLKGAECTGYPPICASGENTCILHYDANRRLLASGDLQLNDMGAEYHGYSADVTRTLPVSGRFTVAQKAIYELVYQAQEAGIAACKPGNDYNATDKAARDVIKKGLLELGIIKEESDSKKYFFHSTSHYLGLDTHDGGTYGNMKAGSVLTVEPGIYIPEGSPCDPKWWNIGVRIEDDILITETGNENLSSSSPRTIEAIEAMMKEEPMFVK